MNPDTRQLSLRPLVAALALGAVALPGVAQTVSPYTLSASQRFSSDSNVFRRESGREDSDRISAIKRAYRTLYMAGLLLPEAREKLVEQARESEDVRAMLEFVDQSERSLAR